MTTKVAVKQNSEILSEKDIDEVLDMVMMMFMMILMLTVVTKVITPTLTQASNYYAAQSIIGLTESQVLTATAALQMVNFVTEPPYTAFKTISFFNDGLTVNGQVIGNSVFIGINNSSNMHEILYGEQYNVDMTNAAQGINTIYYQSTSGTSVRVVGKY
jgi:hypothetical protein